MLSCLPRSPGAVPCSEFPGQVATACLSGQERTCLKPREPSRLSPREAGWKEARRRPGGTPGARLVSVGIGTRHRDSSGPVHKVSPGLLHQRLAVRGGAFVCRRCCCGNGLVSESAVRRGRGVCACVRPFGELDKEYQFIAVTWTSLCVSSPEGGVEGCVCLVVYSCETVWWDVCTPCVN